MVYMGHSFISLPEWIGQTKSELCSYHKNGIPKKPKVHELREQVVPYLSHQHCFGHTH